MFFVASHYLEVDVVEASHQDPHLEVVELPEGAEELEEGLKDNGPLLVVEVIVKTGPGGDCERDGSGDLRRRKRERLDFHLRPKMNHRRAVHVGLGEELRDRSQIHQGGAVDGGLRETDIN